MRSSRAGPLARINRLDMANLIPRLEFAMQALLRRQRFCPFCNGQNHGVVARKYGVVWIRHCQDCFLYFTDPIYQSYLGELYDSLYAAEGATTTLPGRQELNYLKATNFASSDKCCTEQIEALRRLTPHRRLLEVGSSWGYFLSQARVAGFAVTGVEPGRTRRKFGVQELGVDIYQSVEALPEGQFDVVYCAHTLEHIIEVLRFLAGCHDRLEAGGLLVIDVPHFDLRALGSAVLPIIGAVHPLGLSASFFRTALPQMGFQVTGIFDQWTVVPTRPTSAPGEGVLIVVAEKRRRL